MTKDKYVPCGTCNGSGGDTMRACYVCGGSGSAPTLKNKGKGVGGATLLDKYKRIMMDHKRKSSQLRQLKKKLKFKTRNSVPLSKLEKMLASEKRYELDNMSYYYMPDGDSEYRRDSAAKDARIELLEDLIGSVKSKNRR